MMETSTLRAGQASQALAAESHMRKINAPNLVPLVHAGMQSHNGVSRPIRVEPQTRSMRIPNGSPLAARESTTLGCVSQYVIASGMEPTRECR